MKVVRAAFDADADDAAHEVAELGRRVLGDHVELLNGVKAGCIADRIFRYLVVVHAVEQEVIRLFAVSINVAGGRH